jgi:hypothetical protein
VNRRFLAIPAAVLGMLGAHSLAYRLVAPDDRHRHDLLELTGHGWGGVVPLLLTLAAVGLIVGSWQRASRNGRRVKLSDIILTQSVLYAVVEVAERAIAGQPLWPGASLLVAGALVQLPVALFVWSVLRYVIDPIVAALRERFSYPVDEPTPGNGFAFVACSFISLPARCTAGRGPPFIA